MTDPKRRLLERVGEDLTGIEAALTENLTPYLDLVSDAARHILFAGGKRLRPLLMVLSARLCGYSGTEDKRFSVVFEYLHAATLLHDDLVDGAAVRRGKTVAHRRYGNETAVLVGDFLLARSLSIAAQTGLLEVIRTIAAVTENMSQGEIEQLSHKGSLALTEAGYLRVIESKTAWLIRGACRVGALVAGAPEDRVTGLSDFGYRLGMAFQMADDLLDYVADSRQLGKEPGADLREGKLTLPVIYALGRAEPGDHTRMMEILRQPEFDPAGLSALVRLLDRYGAIDYTRQRASQHIASAKETLEKFPPSETRTTLEMIADYALVRQY